MKKEDATKLTESLTNGFTKVRNRSFIAGMRTCASMIIDFCNDKKHSPEEKLQIIKDFCEKTVQIKTEEEENGKKKSH